MRNIASDGSFIGKAGYPRGWQNRSSPNFSDLPETWQIENLHGSNPNLCAPGEQDPSNQGSVPRLQTTPGSPIALLYQENGHVTIPSNNPAKPANRGTVYIYATQKPKAGEKYYDVYQKWNVAGTGGDGRGKLISTQNFDDGRCFQINNGAISKTRQAANKFTPSDPMGSNLWCQNNIVIPHDVDTSKLLTLYWVWKWDDVPHIDPKVWNGQNQTYTSCMDITVTPPSGKKAVRKFAYVGGQSPQKAALGNVFNKLATGNVFAVSAYIDGLSPTPTGAPSSVTYSIVTPSATALAPAVQASTLKPASGSCNGVVSTRISTETIFVYGSSTGTIAPTGTGLSFSTEGVSVAATNPSHASQAQVSQAAATSASITGVLVTQISDGQPEAAAATSAIASQVSQASDGQPQVSAATSNAATSVSQISDGQPQAPVATSPIASKSTAGSPAMATSASTSASAAAATSTIGDNPVVVPVPTNPTASFTFEPSVTQTATPILSSSAPYSNGTTIATTSAVTAGAASQTLSTAATVAASSTISSSPASSSTKVCKARAAKRQSKIFRSVDLTQEHDSIDRAHPRHFPET